LHVCLASLPCRLNHVSQFGSGSCSEAGPIQGQEPTAPFAHQSSKVYCSLSINIQRSPRTNLHQDLQSSTALTVLHSSRLDLPSPPTSEEARHSLPEVANRCFKLLISFQARSVESSPDAPPLPYHHHHRRQRPTSSRQQKRSFIQLVVITPVSERILDLDLNRTS
jgi:hypothetical protein